MQGWILFCWLLSTKRPTSYDALSIESSLAKKFVGKINNNWNIVFTNIWFRLFYLSIFSFSQFFKLGINCWFNQATATSEEYTVAWSMFALLYPCFLFFLYNNLSYLIVLVSGCCGLLFEILARNWIVFHVWFSWRIAIVLESECSIFQSGCLLFVSKRSNVKMELL